MKRQQKSCNFKFKIKEPSQTRKTSDPAKCGLLGLSRSLLHPALSCYNDPTLQILEPLAHLSSLAEILSSPAEQIIHKQFFVVDHILSILDLSGISIDDNVKGYTFREEWNSNQSLPNRDYYLPSHKSESDLIISEVKKTFLDSFHSRSDRNATPKYMEFEDKRRRPRVRPFTMPPGIESWKSITIIILSDDKAEVRIGGHAETRDFIHWGMADYRTIPLKPNSAWILLLSLATGNGDFGWNNENATPNSRTHMKLLRTHFRELFGLYEDPFEDYRKNKCWRTKFNLVDMRKQLH